MEKEPENTLDLVLDIENPISLNPFDRPPNIMDDDLNSVTQEELEANLSTDCPISNMESTAPTSWEQLLQSVLDTSTQDAVEQQNQISETSTPNVPQGSEALGILITKEIKSEKQSDIHQKIGKWEHNVTEAQQHNLNECWQSVEKKQRQAFKSHLIKTEKSFGKDNNDDKLNRMVNKEQPDLEISVHSEPILEPDVNDCYVDTINHEDVDNVLCQVEVYSSLNNDLENDIKEEISDDEEYDNVSNASSISIGRLEEGTNHDENKGNDNVSQLSIINSDHCYSQEKVTTKERDSLKQNFVKYMVQQSGINDPEKLSNLVEKIFQGLDNHKVDILLQTLDVPNQHSDESSTCMQNENQSELVINTVTKDHQIEESAATEDANGKALENTSMNIKVNIQAEESTGCRDNSSESYISTAGNKELLDETEPINNIVDKDFEPMNEVNVETSTAMTIIEESESFKSIDESEHIATNESIESKALNESLPENCSEPMEHHIFDEEFDLLCKTGNLTLDKYKPEITSQLLRKLTDFVTHMQEDCKSFSSASTNIEHKLHDYIRQQYDIFHETFKQYCLTTAIKKQSVETQTDFKKLTKRHKREMNMESKKLLLKTSDKSSQSSTSSVDTSTDEEDDVHFKTQKPNQSNKNNIVFLDSEANIKKEKCNNASVTFAASSNIPTNHSQEYDDGINLSQYVESEIFDIESTSQQSPLPSSVEDSDVSAKEHSGDEDGQNKYLATHGDSDSTILYKPRKVKKTQDKDTSAAALSSSENNRSRKSRTDNVSVNSESDKENLSSGCKDKKTHDSMDEADKNDKEIERLINIDGLTKRSISNGTSAKSIERSKAKIPVSKNLNDRFDFMDVEFGSDDEVKSEAEEEVITEKQFLERCNEDIKRQMLNESSTDSDELGEEDEELLKGASEEDDESGKNSPLVEKFLKTFVVDDSDNDEDVDEDEDIDLDSEKEDEVETVSSNKDSNKDDEPEDLAIKQSKGDDATNNDEVNGESPKTSDKGLLNDDLLFRKRGNRPQKLDKMLSDAEKRKRISKIDEELISLSSGTEHSDVEEIDVEAQSTKPRAIKPMLRPDQLAGETIKAQKRENERISRLEKKHSMLDKILKEHPEADKHKELILDYIRDTKTFIKVHPAIVKHLKPHQFEGVRFMYDSCYGGVDSLKKSPGSGCILAHCMGLGKTLQLIALLHTVISYKELKTTKILVLCPKSTVMNWVDEIIRWLDPLRQKNLKVYTFNDTSDIYEKLSILREWSASNHTRAGCLLIGYEAFRTLVFYHSYKNRGNVSATRLEEIRKNVNNYLLQPGADLVICDEGHIIKNSKSAISMAVAQIVTPRRIVLTGTPIQNNLKEYYSMVNFIKPLFLGTEKEFANLYANPIKNGQHKDSGKADIKVMKQRSFVLHKKLSKFVQRKEAELLKSFLPQKFEYVLFIPMTDVQNNLYQHILNAITNRDETYRGKGLITDYTCLRKIWTHPKVLEDAWKNAVNQRNKKEIRQKQKDHNSEDDQPDDIYDSQTGQMSVTNDWWRSLVTERDLESIMPSNKLMLMFKILQMCEEKGEKCLIFSAFVAVLNVVEYFFRKITDNDQAVRNELHINNHSQWILGKDYYRLDGKTPKLIRHAMINEFNNVLNKRARVFLISAKAGGQGINLIGANRVIILDTSWNPSNDQQNIFRVFRLGQKRNCYIYRLLAMGTMEEKVYSRSVVKQSLSFRVVDEQQIDRHYNMAELAELYILTIPDKNNRPTPILPQDSILARLLRSFPELVYKYHEHDSLLENKVEQELSEQEKNEAWTAYERDMQMNSEIREMPNIEDLQNKFNASNLANYMSPFSGLDVSNNTVNTSNNKNMSQFFATRGFNQPLLQSLLGPNSNAATTQQYIEMLNYYKNLGTYADLNSYSTLSAMGAGRMPPSTSTAANPLAALGDLSMYGLASSALQGLGPSTANSMNLASSVLAGALPPMPTSSASSSMYTSPSPSMLASTAALSSAALTNTTNSAALSAFEQYTQSLRTSFPNMYSYADFGIGSSGSTILDKSKSNKNPKHSSSSSNKNTTNLPGGSKGGSNSMSLYPGSSAYLTQHSQQTRPSSRNTPTESSKQKSTTSSSSSLPTSTSNPMTSSLTNAMTNVASVTNASKSNTTMQDIANSLINYRRSESSGSTTIPTKQSAASAPTAKRDNSDLSNGSGSSKTSGHANITPISKQTSKSLSIQTPPNPKHSQKSSSGIVVTGSNKSSNVESSSRTVNMGISYPNSRGQEKSPGSKSNSPMNMGIVYPRSSTKSSNSEMQIIPTSSPPGTTSISKQLNDLSPSISLTAVKNSVTNKAGNSNVKSSAAPQSLQINKVMHNNTTIRRNASPVTSGAANSSKAAPGNSSPVTAQNQSKILARFKATSNKKPTNIGNINPPPLHRAQTTLGTTGSAVNISAKTAAGLTITNVKTPAKTQATTNKQQVNANSANQASTLAKQQAAASVAKSNIQRTSTPTSNVINPTSNSSNLQKSATSPAIPSLTSIKRTIIKRASPQTSASHKLPAISSSSVTVTSSNKLPIISSVKSISPAMATISKSNQSATGQHEQNLPSMSNVSKTMSQMQKRSSTSQLSTNSANSVSSTVNIRPIRPVDNKQNTSGMGGGVYIIETNINDKKVAIGAPTKSGGGTTVTKVPQQNPNKRKATDPLSKDISIESKRLKN